MSNQIRETCVEIGALEFHRPEDPTVRCAIVELVTVTAKMTITTYEKNQVTMKIANEE